MNGANKVNEVNGMDKVNGVNGMDTANGVNGMDTVNGVGGVDTLNGVDKFFNNFNLYAPKILRGLFLKSFLNLEKAEEFFLFLPDTEPLSL